jgi:hypothetical protein
LVNRSQAKYKCKALISFSRIGAYGSIPFPRSPTSQEVQALRNYLHESNGIFVDPVPQVELPVAPNVAVDPSIFQQYQALMDSVQAMQAAMQAAMLQKKEEEEEEKEETKVKKKRRTT